MQYWCVDVINSVQCSISSINTVTIFIPLELYYIVTLWMDDTMIQFTKRQLKHLPADAVRLDVSRELHLEGTIHLWFGIKCTDTVCWCILSKFSVVPLY